MQRYEKAFDALLPTEAQEERMLREILTVRGEPPRKRRRNNPVRVAALTAAALALTAATASAAEALGVSQMIRDYFQQKEEVNVMDSLNLAASGMTAETGDGWKVTITDLFGDDNRFLAGVTVKAPAGTVLNHDCTLQMSTRGAPHTLPESMMDYEEDGSLSILDGYLQCSNWYAKSAADENPKDNKLSFVFDEPLIYYQDGVNVSFRFDRLFWYEPPADPSDPTARNILHVVKDLNVEIPNVATHFSTNGCHLSPNVSLEAFEGTVTLSKVTLTPLTLSYELSGETVEKQFFNWRSFWDTNPYERMSEAEVEAYLDGFQPTRKERFTTEGEDAPAWGWQNLWYKDIPVVAHFKDGTSLELAFDELSETESVCAEKNPETKTLSVSRTFDRVFDLNQLDYLTFCDVRVTLPASAS